MAITRHIVELHGGTIRAYSAGVGQGATFTVELPLMIMHKPEHVPATATKRGFGAGPDDEPLAELPRLDGLHVLVVDDEHDARDLLSTVLTQSGATVTAVGTVAEALERVQLRRPDLLVSDIEMPGEDGYALIRKLRSLDKAQGGATPAIALTAHARFSDRLRALSAGFQLHVPKPVEPAELVVVIANLSNRI